MRWPCINILKKIVSTGFYLYFKPHREEDNWWGEGVVFSRSLLEQEPIAETLSVRGWRIKKRILAGKVELLSIQYASCMAGIFNVMTVEPVFNFFSIHGFSNSLWILMDDDLLQIGSMSKSISYKSQVTRSGFYCFKEDIKFLRIGSCSSYFILRCNYHIAIV